MRAVKTNEEAFVRRLADNFNLGVIRLGLVRYTGPLTYSGYEQYLNGRSTKAITISTRDGLQLWSSAVSMVIQSVIQSVQMKVRPLTLIANGSLTVRPMALGGLSLERTDNFQLDRPHDKIASRYVLQWWITK